MEEESEEERADLRSLRVVLLGMARYGFPVEHLERLVAVEEEQQLQRAQEKQRQAQQAKLLGTLSSRYRLNIPRAAASTEGSAASPSQTSAEGGAGGGGSAAKGGWEKDGGDEVVQGLQAMVDTFQMSAETEEEYLRLFRTLRDVVASILPEAKVVVVGSIASGLALTSSDCDMTVIAPGRAPADVLRQVNEEMDKRYREMEKAAKLAAPAAGAPREGSGGKGGDDVGQPIDC